MNDDQQNLQGGHEVRATPPAREPRGSGGRATAIALAVFGGVVLLGAGGTAAFAATHDLREAAHPRGTGAQSQSVSVDGVESLRVDVAGSDVTARFGDVDEATLEVDGKGRSDWKLERHEDELVVSSPDRGFGGWFDIDWFGDDWLSEETVILTLPESLNDGRLDAEFTLSAGSLDIDGAYGEVDIEVGAGALKIDGSAESLDADVSAGRADVTLAGVTEADFTVSAGKIVAELIDTTPSSVSIDVSAGSLDLTVPDDAYRVNQEVSAGSLDNRLDTSNQSRFVIEASVSAGSVVLRAGD
ncbi:hypothetical protein [Microbacterium sp.]|uniref:hypothetical protein n=1 Tax=Microbacterium sp. TaxID=51671 RepID=UPI003A8EA12E